MPLIKKMNIFFILLIIISIIQCNNKTIESDDDDDDSDDYENEQNNFIEKEELEKHLNETFVKFKINKDSIISKETLKEMFIYLFNNGEESKENSNMSKEEIKSKDVLNSFFDEAFKRLTYDLEDEKINYETIKEVFSADKLGKVMEDSFSNLARMFSENEDDL